MFLRWEDIIRRDFARPAWWKIVHMYRTFGSTLLNGVLFRASCARIGASACSSSIRWC